MLFHTWTFLVFFAVVLCGFYTLKQTRFWLPWLMLASYVFYGWWNPYYLILILYSTALDYWVVQWMDRCPDRRNSNLSENIGGGVLSSRLVWLWVSIVNNLSLLFFFKYATFFIINLNGVLARLGTSLALPEADRFMPFGLEYMLPVGISFFTFQSMSYTIDFYFGKIHREKSFVRFATFVSFFPQLVAGPIERAKNLLPQFDQFPTITKQDVTDGLSLFLVGLFKKVALANYLSFYVERIYGDPSMHDSPALVLGTVAFAWQIYFDFSGYTDMARGVARVMGFRLMLNFNHPYLASSLGDFWGRWHISLSTWFRDYVYIPLGGNRKGAFVMYRNLFITFVISGFWHGAAWTFVVWGALHAVGTMITRSLESLTWYRERVPKLVKQLGVFGFVCFAWIFFRAESLTDAWLIITRIFTSDWTDPQMPLMMLLMVGLVWLYQWVNESRIREWAERSWVKVGMGIAMLLYLFLFSAGGGEFIYFQF
jgi:alginate O-acetyltransferase complex protein AlgI